MNCFDRDNHVQRDGLGEEMHLHHPLQGGVVVQQGVGLMGKEMLAVVVEVIGVIVSLW